MVKNIAHLADIHIRKLHRFVEYRQVFKTLYKQLKDLKPDLIFIGGDVVHGKLDTSPEEVRMGANFFLELAKISPTIVIPGNHDCNLNNKSREDTLSPIVDLVKKLVTKRVKKVYVALDSDAKKDSAKLVQFLMDNGIESYLLNMNDKDPSELGFENFWKRISKTEQSTFTDIIKGKLYG